MNYEISKKFKIELCEMSQLQFDKYNNAWMTEKEKKQREKDKSNMLSESDYAMLSLREERNGLLTQSDWVVIKEREEGGSVSNFADWKKYRQELRDITKTYKSLDEVKWPTAPSE